MTVAIPAASASSTSKGSLVQIANISSISTPGFMNFTNIPQNYKHLYVTLNVRSNLSANTDVLAMFWNAFTGGTEHSATIITSTGTSINSNRLLGTSYWNSLGEIPALTSPENIFATVELDISNYSSTSTFKSGILKVMSNRDTSGSTNISALTYRSNSAITSLAIFSTTGAQTFAVGSSATLYGIRGK